MSGVDSLQTYNNPEASTNQLLVIGGSFEMNGTGAVANARGDGFTVARTAAGKFRVTFAQSFSADQLISFVPGFEDDAAGAADDTLVSSEPFDASTNSVLIRSAVNSVLTDDDGPRINFVALFNKNQLLASTHT
jgi:hypothetical protein